MTVAQALQDLVDNNHNLHTSDISTINRIIEAPRYQWTPVVTLNILHLLNKYGMDTSKFSRPTNEHIYQYSKRVISRLGDFFIIRFPHDHDLVLAVRQLPHCKHNDDRNYWYLPFKYEYIEAVLGFACRMNFRLLCEHDTLELKHAQGLTEGEHTYLFKTKPFVHQLKVFNMSRNHTAYAFLMEQGTGKTKPLIDTAAWLYGQNKINALLVVTLNGVHLNWTEREIPAHMPDHVPTHVLDYQNKQTKKYLAELDTILDPEFTGLRILAISFDSIITKRGEAFVKRFLSGTRAMMVVDESQKIKNPSRKVRRTNTVIRLGKLAKYRRIATGTPITQSPFDFYAQFKFLDPEIIGFRSYTAFKHHFAEWERHKTDNNKRGFFEELVEYKNMDELTALVSPYAYRIKKSECLDLPDKIYKTIIVPMSSEQEKHYRILNKTSRIELDGYLDALISGLIDEQEKLLVGPKNVLTKLLRLQQLTGGFLATDAGELIQVSTTKLDALVELIEETKGKVIIWARFKHEIRMIHEALTSKYGKDTTVLYYGDVKKTERHENIDRFEDMDSPVRFFIGQQQSGGIGITLVGASTVVYYSNDFSLEHRLQSEDRSHRIGQEKHVTYIDLECRGTIDSQIIQVLTSKAGTAEEILKNVKSIHYTGNSEEEPTRRVNSCI